MRAAEFGHPDTVTALLDKGADNTAVTTHGFTAIDMARAKGHDECVTALKERRCVVCDITADGAGRVWLLKCNHCGTGTFYCSKACQKKNWPVHKLVCQPQLSRA